MLQDGTNRTDMAKGKDGGGIVAAPGYSSEPAKREFGALSLVVLTPDQESEVIEYINWDVSGALACGLGFMLEKMRDGQSFEEGGFSDPESQIIEAMDRIARFREVHQVMLAIGEHARTLGHAYVLARHPPYVDKQFGKLSGVALSMSGNADRLSDACRIIALKGSSPEAKEIVGGLRRKASAAYYSACRAYSDTRKAERVAKNVSLPGKRPAPSVPHYCREGSPIHKCPCGGGE